jgi:hypothetical protein
MKLNFLSAGLFLAAVSTGWSQPITFTKITTGAIVTDQGNFTRAAWGDFNNTGFLDLFVSQWGGPNLFYWNNDGTFTKVTQGDPVQDSAEHTGAVAADFDNDGHLDLLVSATGATSQQNRLYYNEGAGRFSRAGGGALTNQSGFFDACTWADYDNDGLLDLFVTDNGPNLGGGKNFLFHNEGDRSFSKVAAGAVTNDVGVGYGALWADYDNDGFMDLLVINNVNNSRCFLYHNNRNGTFTPTLTNPIATDIWSAGAQGGAWADYDNDGLLDLFVTDSNGAHNRLYHNNGNGAFTNVSAQVAPMVIGPGGGAAVGAAWGDYDNDGYLDLFVTYNTGTGRNALYHNNGDGTFTQILTDNPVEDNDPGIAPQAPAWVDYDNDGFLDLFVTRFNNNGSTSNLLYHNDGNTNAWLEVKLVGMASNRSAIGAKVRVHATIGGQTFWQLRQIDTGGGWNIVPLVAHFGLGDAASADTMRIEWPSGIVQTLTNVAARQILTVVEHQSGVSNAPKFTGVSHATNSSVTLSATGAPGFLYLFEGSTNLVNWTWLGVRSNAVGTVQFADLRATNHPSRFYRVSIP